MVNNMHNLNQPIWTEGKQLHLPWAFKSCSTAVLMVSRDTKAVICYPTGGLITIYYSAIFKKLLISTSCTQFI
jgi:hypothetical protein